MELTYTKQQINRNRRALARLMRALPPERHDQGEWGTKTPCGTTMCLAGHEVNRARGWRLEWEFYKYEDFWNLKRAVSTSGQRFAISRIAGERLGLTENGQTVAFLEMAMFSGETRVGPLRTKEELADFLEDLADGEYPEFSTV